MKLLTSLCFAAATLFAAGHASADTCKMNFKITNSTGTTIKVDKVQYKHKGSTWDTVWLGKTLKFIATGKTNHKLTDIKNGVIGCKKKRKFEMRAKCHGESKFRTFSSGWVKGGGKRMAVTFNFSVCPAQADPAIEIKK